MKLTALFLLVVCMQVSARSWSQTVTLRGSHMPLEKVFREIHRQTGYNFLYNVEWLNTAKPVTIEAANAPLAVVLDRCFSDQPFTYSLVGNTITLKLKTPSPALRATTAAPDGGPILVSGKVVDSSGAGLGGATIHIVGTRTTVQAGSKGDFSILMKDSSAVLEVSYVGFVSKQVSVSGADVSLTIRLERATANMKEAEIVSTGYQTLPKERATGSFEQVNNALFNRTAGQDVLSHLEGISSIFFDKRSGNNASIIHASIRGVSTINSNQSPLIIMDNFPFDGDISAINPNDVESVTILKDAAAASIWGARAGNGVIVITTKKGKFDQPMEISFNSNVSVQSKPDLFGMPLMSTADYIGVERYLYGNGYDRNNLNNTYTYPYISPVVQLLSEADAGTITAAQANAGIDSLSRYDVRNDYLHYYYRPKVHQQYALNLRGGSQVMSYMVSGGYDKTDGPSVLLTSDRTSLRTYLSFKPVKKLEFNIGGVYTQTTIHKPSNNSTGDFSTSVIPYTRWVDANGNPLPVGQVSIPAILTHYGTAFRDTAGGGKLLNWQYYPIQDMHDGYSRTMQRDMQMNLKALYHFNSVFTVEADYQGEATTTMASDYSSVSSFYARNLINLYTQLNRVTGIPTYAIPMGGILGETNASFGNYLLRGMVSVHKTWKSKHQLAAIAGAEVRQTHSRSDIFYTYGYNENNLTYQNVDYVHLYPSYDNINFSNNIPNPNSFSETIYRSTSLYANAAYTYDDRYTVSASARKDAANLYGVNANQRGVPLWSAGLAWNLSHEAFYKLGWLPNLKLRATYGYQGNSNANYSAFTTISYSPPYYLTNLPYAFILNPPNASLRWEKVGNLNLAIDFGLKDNVLSGSLEYYHRHSTDLIASVPLDYTTGFTNAYKNAASLKGRGLDISLHSRNLPGAFKWYTDLLFNYTTNKVDKYNLQIPPLGYNFVGETTTPNPVPGKNVYSIYSYPWAGLDPATGAPMGYHNGKASEDYQTLFNDSLNHIDNKGSAVPLVYGSFRNTFSWKGFELSANLLFNFDYVFVKPSIHYSGLFAGAWGHSDFSRRWQKPGDEKNTYVPSMVYPDNNNRDNFYTYSSALVFRGDNIRLQDITFSYTLPRTIRFMKSIRIYGSVQNVGIIWRANKEHLDPDNLVMPARKTTTVGLNVNF